MKQLFFFYSCTDKAVAERSDMHATVLKWHLIKKQNRLLQEATASDIKTNLCDHPAWTLLYFKTEKDINKKQYNNHSRNRCLLWPAGCISPEPSLQTRQTCSFTFKQTLQSITLSQKYFCISCIMAEYILVGKKKQLWQLFGKSFHILFTSYLPVKATP